MHKVGGLLRDRRFARNDQFRANVDQEEDPAHQNSNTAKKDRLWPRLGQSIAQFRLSGFRNMPRNYPE